MSKIGSFNRSNVALLKQDVDAALKAVGEKYGITFAPIDMRAARDGSFVRLYKQDIVAPAWRSQVEQTMASLGVPNASQTYDRITRGVTLEEAMARDGIISSVNAKGDRLTHYKHGNKYCYHYTSARGAEWRIPVEEARKRFGYRAPTQAGSQQQPSAS